jgi:hypothetical protein
VASFRPLVDAFDRLTLSLSDWHAKLASEPAPTGMSEAAEQVLADSRRVLDVRAGFLQQVQRSKEWGSAHGALVLGGGAIEVVAAARQVAEQLWARAGAPCFSKMASRLSEFPIPRAPMTVVVEQFRDRMDRLNVTWKGRMDEARRALTTLGKIVPPRGEGPVVVIEGGEPEPVYDGPRTWQDIYQPNRIRQVEDTLRLWCEENSPGRLNVANLDKIVVLLAYDFGTLKEMARQLRQLHADYSDVALFVDDTIDGLLETLQGRISFHVGRIG